MWAGCVYLALFCWILCSCSSRSSLFSVLPNFIISNGSASTFFSSLFFLWLTNSRPFSVDWWIWLTMTGLSIGWVTSVKMVGLFVTALVGLYTIEDLWDKFGDLRMSAVRTRHLLPSSVHPSNLLASETKQNTGERASSASSSSPSSPSWPPSKCTLWSSTTPARAMPR